MGAEDIEKKCRESPQNIRFEDLYLLCAHYFGQPRRSGGSHHVFKMPWSGDPRINIQNDHGRAKAYQVRQVLRAIDHLKDTQEEGTDNDH